MLTFKVATENQDIDKTHYVKKGICLFLLCIPTLALAQLELYGKFTEQGSIEPIVNYSGNKIINEKLSVTFFGLIRKTWSQALIGLSYSPGSTVSFSTSIGIEHGKRLPRYAASIWMKKKKTSLLLLGELGSGKDNYLYKVNLFYQCTDQFSFGGTAWRYHGLGPNFRFLISKLETTIWAMPAYDLEVKEARVMLGISLKM